MEWLQDLRADCIPIEGRPDLAVVIVSRTGAVIHTEVVAADTEDSEAMDFLPEQRPMPYGRYRTCIEDTRPTKKVARQGSDDMPVSLPAEQPEQELKQ